MHHTSFPRKGYSIICRGYVGMCGPDVFSAIFVINRDKVVDRFRQIPFALLS